MYTIEYIRDKIINTYNFPMMEGERKTASQVAREIRLKLVSLRELRIISHILRDEFKFKEQRNGSARFFVFTT